MTENKILNIRFALLKITCEQFGIIEESFSETFKEGATIRINSNIRFNAEDDNNLISCYTAFTFESSEKPFMKIEAGCHFKIHEETWQHMFNSEALALNVPKGLLDHLATLTVGTTRGILFAKTEGTIFNKFILPTINVASMIKGDAVFTFENSTSK